MNMSDPDGYVRWGVVQILLRAGSAIRLFPISSLFLAARGWTVLTPQKCPGSKVWVWVWIRRCPITHYKH